jgi:phosphatidylglycerophosphatase A
MQNFPNLKNPLHFIATLGGLGKIPIAPGTFGSIFAWFVFIFLSHYINMIFLTFAVGIFSVWICEKITKDLVIKDHKSIIIDELVGTWISLLPVLFIADDRYERIIYAAIALILFRFFDILKPYPISFFDKEYKNGLGIVLDDVIAGIFSGILSVILLILLI